MSSLLFVAVLIVLVSGLIAYIGDLVGRKMGRKRLTLLGLRPRHTAIVISVAAGMLIAALTLAVTFAVSQGVRDAFFTPLSTLRANLAQQRSELDRIEHELADARREAEETLAQLAEKTSRLEEANTRLEEADRQRASVQQRLSGSRAELSTIQRRLQENQQLLTGVRSNLGDSQAQLSTTTDLLKQGARTLIEQESELRRLEESLGEFMRMTFTPLAFPSGQEILSGLIPVGGEATDREALLRTFLTAAERVLRQRSPELAADTPAIIYLRHEDQRLARITANEAVHDLNTRIAGIDGALSAIVRLAPANNVPVNGQALVAVDLVEIIPNTPAYRAGDEVARLEMSITDATTTADVLSRLADDLLRERIPAALRNKGVVMVLRRFNPARPDETPEATWSLMPWTNLVTAAEQAQQMRGALSIVARSRSAVSRFGPMDLVLEVVPAGSP